jgi:excinuclease ABC subunit A
MLLSPIVRGRRGKHDDVFRDIRKAGFVRVRVDGQVVDIDDAPELDSRRLHQIEAVVDRIIVRATSGGRLAESIELAVRHGQGLLIACYQQPEESGEKEANGRRNGGLGNGGLSNGGQRNGGQRNGGQRNGGQRNGGQRNGGQWHERLFSTLYACPNCKISYEELEPRTFSFNSPYGACPRCDGLGWRTEFDPELVIPDPSLSAADGAIAPWKGVANKAVAERLSAVADCLERSGASEATPIGELTPRTYEKLLAGDGKKFPGLLILLEKEYATATSVKRKQQLELYRGKVRCAECGGSRLRPEAASVRLGGKAIHEITALSVAEARAFFAGATFPAKLQPVAKPLIGQIAHRLEFLEKVGTEYLTLDRAADTLSGGELQRVRLATGIGSGLVGVCYVLDEPSIGLHPRDNQRLIDALRDLERLGNTVLVVEHDEAMIRQADHLIDFGPGAGRHGGRIVAQGRPAEVSRNVAAEVSGVAAESQPTGGNSSLTRRYLAGELKIEVPANRRKLAKTRSLVIEGVRTNNLKNLSVRFPLGGFVCVTGVSGSGKSSLLNETLTPALVRRLGGAAPKPGPHDSLRGVAGIDKVVEIDQSPIGRTPRSNAATYTGALDEIRKVFAGTREAKQRGFRGGRFSFNAKSGRCEACQGQGVQKIEMNFLPDLYVPCDECHGRRYNRQTLEVHYRGQTIADVLEMPIEAAAEFFANFSAIHRLLEGLDAVGLGYLPLGQPSTTLSGGEAQRIKLATELARVDTGKTVYVLDEPTTGLHFADVQKLLAVLSRLVDRGNTVIVVEHHLDVIKCADWLIDLGPEGGAGGGQLIAEGTPEDVAATACSHTGRCLRRQLGLSP